MSRTGELDGIGPGYIVISSPDGRDNFVDERVLATSPDGRYLARCGEYVLSTALCAPPGRVCPVCLPRPVPTRPEPRMSPVRLRGLLAAMRPSRGPRLRVA